MKVNLSPNAEEAQAEEVPAESEPFFNNEKPEEEHSAGPKEVQAEPDPVASFKIVVEELEKAVINKKPLRPLRFLPLQGLLPMPLHQCFSKCHHPTVNEEIR